MQLHKLPEAGSARAIRSGGTVGISTPGRVSLRDSHTSAQHDNGEGAAAVRLQPRFARRTAEGGCPYIDLLQAFHEIQICQHSVISEDAGLRVGGHVDGADVFYAGGVGGH